MDVKKGEKFTSPVVQALADAGEIYRPNAEEVAQLAARLNLNNCFPLSHFEDCVLPHEPINEEILGPKRSCSNDFTLLKLYNKFELLPMTHKPPLYIDNFCEARTFLAKIEAAEPVFDKHILIPIEFNTDFINKKQTFKDEEYSKALKEEGNKYFKDGDFRKAIKLYTKSIAYAPTNTKNISLCYANRSAALYKKKKYQECLIDIEKGIHYGYPEENIMKLYIRQGQCYRDLGLLVEAKEKFQIAEEHLNSYTFSDIKIKNEYEQSLKKERNASPSTEKDTDVIHYSPEPPALSYGPHLKIPCASSALNLAQNKEIGSHFVANRDIAVGDVLIVEEPYAVALKDQYIWDRCTHCRKYSFSLIPCQNCPLAMFCNEECLEAANKEYHAMECPIIINLYDYVETNFMIIIIMVVRMLCKLGFDKLDQYIHYAQKSECCRRGLDENEIYDSSNFDTILNLYSFVNQIPAQVVYFVALEALFISHSLNLHMKKPEYTGLIYKLLLIAEKQVLPVLDDNLPIYSKTTVKDYDLCVNTGEYVSNYSTFYYRHRIGDSIQPVQSLVSHSCAPNTEFFYYGKYLVTIATEPIKTGSLITYCYDPRGAYGRIEIEKRQKYLESYHFIENCKCYPCFKKLPIWFGLPNLSGHAESQLVEQINKELKDTSDNFIKRLNDNQVSCTYKEFSEEMRKPLMKLITGLCNNGKVYNKEYVEMKDKMCQFFRGSSNHVCF